MGEEVSPAAIYRLIWEHAGKTLPTALLENLDVVMDAHWIYLHSRKFKEHNRLNSYRYNGKWKSFPLDHGELLLQVYALLPHVPGNSLPVVKITNFANMPHERLQLVAYCFPEVAEPAWVREILKGSSIDGFIWRSNRFKEPIP
jgi:hypothetical protein